PHAPSPSPARVPRRGRAPRVRHPRKRDLYWAPSRATKPRGGSLMPPAPSRREILQGAAVAAGPLMIEGCPGGPPAASAATLAPHEHLPGGLEVRGTRFAKDGKPWFVSGINYWAGTT